MRRVARRIAVLAALAGLSVGAALAREPVVNPIEVSVADANPGLEALRGECLTVRAGPGAIQCDDYVFRYDFMPLMRLQRPRTLSLIYNSATAYPRPVVGANILIPTGQSVPDEVRARLVVDGVVLDSLTVDGALLTAGVPQRIAFTFEQYEERQSRIVPFTVEVTKWDNGQAGATASAQGHYIIVDRREEFGRGWWPTGYESLSFSATSDTLLWVGGDGSARAYARVSPGGEKWASVTRGRPDTIIASPANYLDLDGTEYGTASNPVGLEGVSRMTWAFWLYPTGQSGRIGGVYAPGDPNRVWWLEADDSGTELMTVLFNASIGEPAFRTTTGDALTANTWQFVVVQFDGTQSTASERLKLWINGASKALSVPEGLTNYPLPSSLGSSATAPFQWGSISAYTPGFRGRIGETAILDTLLSATERADWLGLGIDFDHPGLVSGYRWENDLTDTEGVNNLTAQGVGSGDYGETSGTYQRRLIGGGSVYYGPTGRHLRTVDRIDNITEFVHTTVPGTGEVRLSSILLPKFSGRDTAFVFQWDSLRLEAVKVRFRDSGDQKWLSYAIATDTTPDNESDPEAFTIRSITTPDNMTVGFGYVDWKGVLDSIADVRGAVTLVSDTMSKVSEVRTKTGDYADIVLAYQAYTTVGSGASGALAPIATSSVSARLDGPRTDVGDTTRFWPTGWGAVKRVRDALGSETTIARDNTSYPAFPTRVAYPNDRVVLASYDALGLLDAVTDSSINATTYYDWDTKWSRVSQVLSPEGIFTCRAYSPSNGNLLRESIGCDSTAHTTRFVYHEPNGMVTRIRPPGYGVDTTYTFGYDAWGNVNSQGTPKGLVTSTHKDSAGRDTLVVTPLEGDTTRSERVYRDLLGRDTLSIVTNERDAQWLHVHTDYDAQTGDRLSVTPYASHPTQDSTSTGSTSWIYDDLGRVATETTSWTKTYKYDLAGNRLHVLRLATDTLEYLRYDALNRLVWHSTDSIHYVPDSTGFAPFPFYSPSGLDLLGDTAQFTYDVMGNLETAYNRYARVRRTYEKDGLVKTDTLRIRNFNDTSFATHVYGIRYVYDKDRRLRTVHHPAATSPGNDSTIYYYEDFGPVRSVVDPLGNFYIFYFDSRERPMSLRFPGSGVDSMTYDLDGRMVGRSVSASQAQGYLSESLSYDDAGKVVTANSDVMRYTGLGHLAYMFQDPAVGADRESWFTVDGFGSTRKDSTVVDSGLEWTPTLAYKSFGSGGRMESSYEEWAMSYPTSPPAGWDGILMGINYDGRGNRSGDERTSEVWDFNATPPEHLATHQQDSRSYYEADQGLRYQQVNRDSLNVSTGTSQGRWGVWEEYWYDALGRRVLKYSYQDPGTSTPGDGLCEISTRCYTSTERYVWSGDQLAWELRHQGGGDNASPSGSDLTGVIGYVHAGGVDMPLAMLRNGTALTLHANWRGLFVGATTTSGQDCVAASACSGARWPGDDAGALRGLDIRTTPSWYGSLALDQQDATGLLYRRNRYYDPISGQFAQEDPIGIAGGLNLYGYANGDPINFSDPFGLNPWWLRYAVGAGAGLVAEGAWQIHSGDFNRDRLIGATLVGALGGGATKIPGLGKFAAQAMLGAGATALEGDTGVGAMVLGGALGVGAEFAGQALTSKIANEGVDAVRAKLLTQFDAMIAHGRSAEDAKAAAMLFDVVVSEHSRGAVVGGLAGLLMNKLQEREGGRE